MNNFSMDSFIEKEFNTKISGRNLYFNCPFCKETSGQNYWFSPDKEYKHKESGKILKGLGRCFKCALTHNTLSFIMQYKKLDFITALNFINGNEEISKQELLNILDNKNEVFKDNITDLFKRNNHFISVELPPTSSKILPKKLKHWFQDVRSYPLEMLKMLNVHYCWGSHHDLKLMSFRNRAIFPIETGGIRAWQAYNFDLNSEYSKTRNPSEPVMQNILFLYENVKNEKLIIIHEGIFDVLRSLTRGFSPVGLLGKHLSFTQAYFLAKTKAQELCVCLDSYTEKGKEKIQAYKNASRLSMLCDKEITVMELTGGYDPDDSPEKLFLKCFNKRTSFENLEVISETRFI